MGSEKSMVPKLCAKGCDVSNNNPCSQCYKDFQKQKLKNHNPTMKNPLIPKTYEPPKSFFTFPPSPLFDHVNNSNISTCFTFGLTNDCGGSNLTNTKNRCDSCNKRVGLTGFWCRCGNVFCGKHRHPEEHECGVDFKAIGREALLQQNPVCKGDKLQFRI